MEWEMITGPEPDFRKTSDVGLFDRERVYYSF
jgi:hypothetical protein